MLCNSVKNIGKLDKAFRLFIGFVVMAHGVYFNSPTMVLISLVILATALIEICPLYKLIKISTLNTKECTLAKKEEAEEEKKVAEHSEKEDQHFTCP